MARVRVRLKHQITIPARLAAAANIKPDDLLEVSYAGGVLTLTPLGASTGKASIRAYAGVARGVWGKTPAAVEAALARQRESWER